MEKKITEKFIEARKNKDNLMKALYESLRAKIIIAEKSGQYTTPLSDDVILSIVKKEIKERKESQSYYDKNGDIYKNYEIMINELQTYLPEELSEDKVKDIIKDVVSKMVDSNTFNRGKAIGLCVKEIGDRFDKSKIAGIVGEVVKELGL
jgi:uncharacterized protein YqeY